MNKQLIYDVGAHVGEDTEFYLKKGFKVVAVEANPVLAENLRKKFKSNIADGSLVVVSSAIAETAGEVNFYTNERSEWGTVRPGFVERNSHMGSPSKSITVRAVSFPEVLREHGVPYYLKIDIEGADLICLEGLKQNAEKPRFVSIESEKRTWRALLYEFKLLQTLGYSKFKIVDQAQISRQRPPAPPAEGRYVDHRFELGSSGLFGEELPGQWLTMRQAIWRYRLIFCVIPYLETMESSVKSH
jgi:FkbM family methyltransferase